MSNIQIVSLETHEKKYWKLSSGYKFAAQDAVCQISAMEVPKAVLSLPIAFMETGDTFILVAVQGVESGKNLLVAPDGRWLSGYVPAFYRGYPFVLGTTEDAQQILCIDEDSDPYTEDLDGEAFYEGDEPSTAITEKLNLLVEQQRARHVTARICAQLQKHGLIQPWPIKMQNAKGESNINGLYKIDEAALTALEKEAFLELREIGALPIAYCQLISMQHLSWFTKAILLHEQTGAYAMPEELDLEFLNDSGSISFGDD